MYKYKYKYKYGLMDPRTSRDADSSLYEENSFIAQGPTTFYKSTDATGAPYYVYPGVGVPDLTKIGDPTGNWNDAIRSVRVGERSRVRMFEHINYEGLSLLLERPGIHKLDDYDIERCRLYESSLPFRGRCLVWWTWDKRVSSLKVQPL
jgi:hypothetical protein